MKFRLLWLLVVALFVFSCKDNEKSRVSADKAVRTRQEVKKEKTIDSIQKKSDPAKNISSVFNYKNNNDYLLTPDSEFTILSEDFEIGTKNNRVTKNKEHILINDTAKTFIDGLISGDTINELLFSESKDVLGAMLEANKSFFKNDLNYILGNVVTFEENIVKLRIRFRAKGKNSRGELYLIKSEKQWYIYDVNIDFNEFDVPYIKKEFDPVAENINNDIKGQG